MANKNKGHTGGRREQHAVTENPTNQAHNGLAYSLIENSRSEEENIDDIDSNDIVLLEDGDYNLPTKGTIPENEQKLLTKYTEKYSDIAYVNEQLNIAQRAVNAGQKMESIRILENVSAFLSNATGSLVGVDFSRLTQKALDKAMSDNNPMYFATYLKQIAIPIGILMDKRSEQLDDMNGQFKPKMVKIDHQFLNVTNNTQNNFGNGDKK